MAPAPSILYLCNKSAVFRFNRFGPTRQALFGVRVPSTHTGRNLLMRRHRKRLSHQHRRSTAGAIQVILNQPVSGTPIGTSHGGHRRMHKTITQASAC
jgi:hypothetical protein